MKLDLDADNVWIVDTTVAAVRSNDFSGQMDLDEAMDNAQAKVFSGDEIVAYVVICIKK